MKGQRILLGVSGGIAAYKALELCRLLVDGGFEVKTVLTRNALQFVSGLSFQILSGNKVGLDTFDYEQEHEIGHIRMAQDCDLVLLAPATANTISKFACGIGDDLLTTILLATDKPVLIAPAMNDRMWENPAIRENMQKLLSRGVRVIDPQTGFLACGTNSVGRLADVSKIYSETLALLRRTDDLRGKKILVSAGGTKEFIDDFRYLSNPSTGKMGIALAESAYLCGAEVTLVNASNLLPAFSEIHSVPVVSAKEMADCVFRHAQDSDCIIMAAAVSDFRPRQRRQGKIKKNSDWSIEYEQTEDILKALGNRKERPVLVGFAAESENLLDYAKQKFIEKNLDLIVANNISGNETGFSAEHNAGIIWDGEEEREIKKLAKSEFAEKVMEQVKKLLKDRKNQ